MKDVFDFGVGLSDSIHRQAEIVDLRHSIQTRVCGECTMWMTRNCPKEKNIAGMRVGPSMNSPICTSYDETTFSKELRHASEIKLTRLLNGN